MRISTAQFYETSAANYQRNYSNVLKTSDEVSSEVRLNTAGDDPLGAARVLQLQQQNALLTQYKSNISTVSTNVTQSESAMTGIQSAIQSAQELVLKTANATYTDKDRQATADELKQLQQQILGLMNSKDASGAYLFSGSKSTTPPYAVNPDGSYSYQGDQTKMNVDIGTGISMATNTTGWDAFEQAINTTRTSTTLTAPATNDGVVALSGGSVTSSVAYDAKFGEGEPYSVSFQSSTQFKITDKNGNDVTADSSQAGAFTSNNASNQTIAFRGLELNLNINLTTAQYSNSAAADAAVAGHTFTLGVSPSSVATSRLPGNTSAAVITGSTVSDTATYNNSFPSGGAILKFTSATDFSMYASPYTAGDKSISSGTMAGNVATAAGISFTVSGAPNANDQFTVQGSTQQTQNVLNTLTTAIKALTTPADGKPQVMQSLQATITSAIGNLKSASLKVGSAIAEGGTRQATSDDQNVTNQSMIDNASNESSKITAADPVDSVARLTLQKTMLQASQLVFTQLSALNLFSKL
ncbi:flagellar hook-associated protein 3 [Pseudomonas huanghezhanensis]|uniref:flagellar hook-associated protein 3 n=1 Tax=Pseudomonas huanghezhanensis TaxID=3002903 RepID=UPI002285D73A|nr:flagellar hook-associated protein 3 [Pseudomonas sp. BSw22131]